MELTGEKGFCKGSVAGHWQEVGDFFFFNEKVCVLRSKGSSTVCRGGGVKTESSMTESSRR